MEINEKKQILKYFKNCITEDTKEELSIEIESKKIDKINSKKIFFPNRNEQNDFDTDFTYNKSELNDFYNILKNA
jgi:hypothetical protein